jgi:hypothetical protein
MALHVNPGLLAYASEYDRNRDAVREAVLQEAAQRMQVPAEGVGRKQCLVPKNGLKGTAHSPVAQALCLPPKTPIGANIRTRCQ